jgi:TPR repeat protein
LDEDAARAYDLVARGCEVGVRAGCMERAFALARGEGVEQNIEQGEGRLRALCDEGFLAACTRLGWLEGGKRTDDARDRGRVLLKKACAGGEQDACTMLDQL